MGVVRQLIRFVVLAPDLTLPLFRPLPPTHPVVVIADAKQSHVEILQIAGRACRTSKDKPCGYVMVPVHARFGEAGTNGQELEMGSFGTVVNVLQTFRERVS